MLTHSEQGISFILKLCLSQKFKSHENNVMLCNERK